MSELRQPGFRSRVRTNRLNKHERYALRKTQAKRTSTAAALTRRAWLISLTSGSPCRPRRMSGNCRPMTMKTKPLRRNATISQKAKACSRKRAVTMSGECQPR